jgi:hypothetical protein
MPPFDTARLAAILDAAQNPILKKLIEDKANAHKSLEIAKERLAELETKLIESIPPALKSILQSDAPAKTKKMTTSDRYLKKPDLQELKQILDRRPANTLNIRMDGFDTKVIKSIALANPSIFVYEKGSWPKVKYLR